MLIRIAKKIEFIEVEMSNLKCIVLSGTSIEIVASAIDCQMEVIFTGKGYCVLDILTWLGHHNGERITGSDKISHSCHSGVGLCVCGKHYKPVRKRGCKCIDGSCFGKTGVPWIAEWGQSSAHVRNGEQYNGFQNMKIHSTIYIAVTQRYMACRNYSEEVFHN